MKNSDRSDLNHRGIVSEVGYFNRDHNFECPFK